MSGHSSVVPARYAQPPRADMCHGATLFIGGSVVPGISVFALVGIYPLGKIGGRLRSRFDRAHQVSDPRISIQSRRFRHVGIDGALHLSGPRIGPRPEHFSVPVPWPRSGSGRSTRMPTTSELRTRDWAACLHAYSPHTLGISVSCSLGWAACMLSLARAPNLFLVQPQPFLRSSKMLSLPRTGMWAAGLLPFK